MSKKKRDLICCKKPALMVNWKLGQDGEQTVIRWDELRCMNCGSRYWFSAGDEEGALDTIVTFQRVM